MPNTRWIAIATIAAMAVTGGCIEHHITVDKPIQINATIDVNLKVDRQLDDFFSDVSKKAGEPATAPDSK